MSRFKIGDKVVPKNGTPWLNSKYKTVNKVININEKRFYLLENSECPWPQQYLSAYKEAEEIAMKKTFREVIEIIKEGEEWESENKLIKKTINSILIEQKDNRQSSVYSFADSTLYALKRKKYSFKDVINAFENGEEIESVVSSIKYKLINDECYCLSPLTGEDWDKNLCFTMDEVQGKWYINN